MSPFPTLRPALALQDGEAVAAGANAAGEAGAGGAGEGVAGTEQVRPLEVDPEPAGGGGLFGGSLMTMLVVFVPVYILLMFFTGRGKNKPPAPLKKNDRVATSGGLIGTVAAAPGEKDTEVAVRFGDNRVSVLRSHLTPLDAGKAGGKDAKTTGKDEAADAKADAAKA